MFFDSWQPVWRVVVVGLIGYAALILLLRLSGNRTLSKLNAFDLIITVAFGSTLASLLLDRTVTLVTGLAALALLVLLQLVITWCSVRSPLISRVVKTSPSLLLLHGQLRHATLRQVRVTSDEVRAAVRQHGHGSLANIDAVILETDGSLSVIPTSRAGDRSAYGALDRPGQ